MTVGSVYRHKLYKFNAMFMGFTNTLCIFLVDESTSKDYSGLVTPYWKTFTETVDNYWELKK